jgi:holo-[acyl-carrier-protein] synthase
MILGVGTDLIDIRRIERVLERYGGRFLDRVFTAAEQARAERRFDRAAAYAKRYAAKEACAKALGTGFRQGVYWRDIGVANRHDGAGRSQPDRRAALRPRGRDHQRRGGRRRRARRRVTQMTGPSLYLGRHVGYCPAMTEIRLMARRLDRSLDLRFRADRVPGPCVA